MIRHIVLFRIKPEFKAEIPALVQNFYTMKGRVEGLVDQMCIRDSSMQAHSTRS